MEAVIFYNHDQRIFGSKIDAFEYYISILEYNPDVNLFFIDAKEKDIETYISIFENRYNLEDLNWKENIRKIKKIELTKIFFDNVLVVDYTTIQKTRGLIKAKNIFVISEKNTGNQNYMYDKKLYNVTYFGEMSFEYRDIDYRMKILFNRFKGNEMNGIIYYSPEKIINGATIDAFEYFFVILKHNPNMYFILISPSKYYRDYFISVMDNRYNIEIPNWKDKVKSIKINELIRFKFNKVIVLDFWTIKHIRGLLSANEVIVISDKHTENSDFMFSKELYNVTYYGEMPFEYRDKKYKIKLLFDKFKPVKKCASAIFINSPRNDDFSFIKDLDLPDKPIIFKTENHKENLFELFDTYVYYHADKWFDPHPRLFLECAYYEKEILYFNEPGIKDGSYYRYNDLMENGLKDRFLNEDDEIVRKFI